MCHGERLRGAVRIPEVSFGGGGRKLYTVKEAAAYLDCSERQVREEIREQKITYRRAPGGIRFTEEDLIDRLRPSGGPSSGSPPCPDRHGCPLEEEDKKPPSHYGGAFAGGEDSTNF
ncbi:helix-turn-helix domain-containing protein [Haloferula sp.]|uniref:helix-turn-helix domain-containing protein n=1 Tax=Haloferula sp. TaxID=2497595 RepID=UPI003C796E01